MKEDTLPLAIKKISSIKGLSMAGSFIYVKINTWERVYLKNLKE